MDTKTLTQILAREVAAYAGEMLNGQLYFMASPDNRLFAVISIGRERTEYSADASLIARIIDTSIVIDHDMNNKPLIDALVQAGVPRQQIIVAYAGESVPEAV
jgi:hypothetical protein